MERVKRKTLFADQPSKEMLQFEGRMPVAESGAPRALSVNWSFSVTFYATIILTAALSPLDASLNAFMMTL